MASIIFKDAAGNVVNEIPLGGGGTTVPAEVRQAILTLFEAAAYASDDVSAAITTVRSWAMEVTAITISQSSASISGANTVQLTATTTPAGGTVTWTSSNTAVATVSSSGLVTGVGNGTATITARCGDLSATCTATVSGFATLTGITATYTQSGTVYDTASLSDLVPDLVVVANYDDSSTVTLTSDRYTLSGTLAEGTSTITVSYGGKTTTFNVTVTEKPEEQLYPLPDLDNYQATKQSMSISNGNHIERTTEGNSRMVYIGKTEASGAHSSNRPVMFSLGAGASYSLKIKNIEFTENTSDENYIQFQFLNSSNEVIMGTETIAVSQTGASTIPDVTVTGVIDTATDVTELYLFAFRASTYACDIELRVDGTRFI